MNLLRRVQEAQEGANRFPEWKENSKVQKKEKERLELSSVQTAELHQQSMNQRSDRLARLEAQPQGQMRSPVSGESEATKDEYAKRIQELQIWVQALNGGTSALLDPRTWKNPILGVQVEQTTQRKRWEELHSLCVQLRDQYNGLLKEIKPILRWARSSLPAADCC